MRKKIVILGAGSTAREALDLVEYCSQNKGLYEPLGFVIDPSYGGPGQLINGKPVLGDFEWLAKHHKEVYVVCGIGHPHHRFHVVRRAEQIPCRFVSLVHPWTEQYFCSRWSSIGEGSMLYGCGVSDQTRIGRHVLIHGYSVVAHNVMVGDFVTISSGVHINGYASIGTGCYIGSGAIIRDTVKIGDWAFVGAGSVVTKDIPENARAVGNPARVIEQKKAGWHLAAE